MITAEDRAEFKRRRDHGLKARHAQRLARWQRSPAPPTSPANDSSDNSAAGDTREQELG